MKKSGFTSNLIKEYFNFPFPINRITFLLACFAVIAVWSSPSFAVGGTPQTANPSATLDADGVNDGVEMIGGTGTLTVDGTDGFLNIYEGNNSGGGLVIDPLDTAVTTTASSTDSILFNSNLTSDVFGTLGVTPPGGPFFLDVSAAGSTNVNFHGSVFTTTMGIGTGTVNFLNDTNFPGLTSTGAVTFTGDGTMALDINTLFIGAINSGGAEVGTLSLADGSEVQGAVGAGGGLRAIEVVGSGGSAAITGGQVDVFTFFLEDNTLNIDGALFILNDGLLTPSINTTISSQDVFGNIVTTGSTTLPTTLLVDVAVPSGTILLPGSFFTILDSGTGPGTSEVTVTSASGYEFAAVPPNTLLGDVVIQVTGIGSALPAATVSQLEPSTPSLAAPEVSFQRTRQFHSLWLSRLNMCRGDNRYRELNPDACHRDTDPRHGWWAQGFGYAADQDARRDTSGYDSTIIGGMMGYDVPLNPDTRAGLGVGYARSSIEGKTFDTETDIDSFQATAYVGHERGPWFVHGSATFGWNEYDGKRHIVVAPAVDTTASTDYSGQDYTAFVRTGYHLFARGFAIIPNASLQYSHINLDGYKETGAGDFNLKAKSEDYDFVESGLGVKVERDISFRGGKAVPEIHFNWFHRLSNPTAEQTASYYTIGAAPFTTQGQDIDDDTLNVGGGISLISCGVCDDTTWSVDAVYDYEWRGDDYDAHQGMLRITGRF